MVERKELEEISVAKKEKITRDVDICLIAPRKNPKDVLREVLRNVDVKGKKYDVCVFEELPLYMKIKVIEEGIPVFGDLPSLGEYFYFYRKLWNDQKHRQKISEKDLEKILS